MKPLAIAAVAVASAAFALGVAALFSGGAGGGTGTGVNPAAAPPAASASAGGRLMLVGLDASGSAAEFQTEWLARVRLLSSEFPLSGRQEIYRFDVGVHELHAEGPIDARKLKRIMPIVQRDRGQVGTSLLELARRFDERLAVQPDRAAEVWIFTDCGVEEMTPADHAALRELAGGWAENPRLGRVTVVGLRPFHREAIRRAFAPLGERLAIE